MDFLPGKKTTIAAIAMILCGVAGLIFGFMEGVEATELILMGLAVFGLGKKIERPKATQ